jgi:hypothetical protein
VGKQGVMDNGCHQDFLTCLETVMIAGSKGFSKKVRQLAAARGLER